MNLKKTLLLGVLLVASVVYLKFVAFPSAKRAAEGGKVFEELSVSELAAISFLRGSGGADGKVDSFDLEKGLGKGVMPRPVSSDSPKSQETTGDDNEATSVSGELREWGIRSLKGAPVDSPTLSGVISAIKDMRLGEEVEQGELEKDFSVYGLNQPALTLMVQRNSKERDSASPVEIAFGKKNEYLGQRYIKVSGRGGVYLVDEASFTAVNKSTTDLRDKTPIRFEDPDLREVEVVRDGSKIKLVQTTVGEWEVQSNKAYKASTASVGELLRTLKDLRVADYMDGATPDNANGLISPQHTITLHFREGVEPKKLEVKVSTLAKPAQKAGGEGETVTYFTYTNSPSILTTLATGLDKLPATFDGYREKKVFALASSEIGKLTVSGSDYVTVELSSDGVDWKVNGKEADPVFADEIVENLMDLKVDAFIYEGEGRSLGAPSRRFEVLRKGSATDKTILVLGDKVAEKGVEYWVGQIEGRAELFRIKDDDIRKVSPREETLLAATPTPLPSPTTPSSASMPK